MLFFRSEDMVRDWCEAHGYKAGPLVSMDRLWRMATTWYADRLNPAARRPRPEEVRGMFAAIGLVGDFWDPLSNAFG